MKEKWVCGKCGREVYDRPQRNAKCRHNGCDGRLKKYVQCACGKWYHQHEKKQRYCSAKCNPRYKKIERKCSLCGKTILRKESWGERKNYFCNRTCLRKYQERLKEKRVCQTCGKEFEVYKSSIDKTNAVGKFCCRKCYDIYQTTLTGEKHHSYTCEIVPCKVCGKSVRATQHRLKTNQNVFCSAECYHKYLHNYVEGEKNGNWKGGCSQYRTDFEKVKRTRFTGIQFCAMCGTTKNIHIHHIIPYRLTQDNDIDNLIPLCASHHKKVEHITMPIYEGYEDKEFAKSVLNALLRPKQRRVQMAVYKYLKQRGLKDANRVS